MLACTALVGCSDDDVLNNAEQENQQAEKIDAYMSFSIASSTNSSRADNGNEGSTNGDSHGSPDDSGHKNQGTIDENQINKVLVLFYNTEIAEDGFAHIYTINTNKTSASVSYHEVDVNLKVNADGTLTPNTPFKLQSTGKYHALIVLNPCEDIEKKCATTITSNSGAKGLYDYILAGQYNTDNGNASGVISRTVDGAIKYDNFMMANQSIAEITVTSNNNTPATAARPTTGTINVERVASKITFRPSAALTSAPNEKLNACNTYKYVEKNAHTTYTVTTSDGWVWTAGYDTEDTNDDTYTYKAVFNYATTNESDPSKRKYIWVLYENQAYSYYEEAGEYEGFNEQFITDKKSDDGWYKTKRMKPYTFTGSPIYQGTALEGSSTDITYYVQLQRYALVNLNNSVFYTRHTSNGNSIVESPVNWGTVSLNNYLQEPFSYKKSNATQDEETSTGWETWLNGSSTTDTWFGDTRLNQVISNILAETADNKTAMLNLPGTIETLNDYNKVEGSNPEDGTIGTHLAYCLENVVASNMQNKHLTTGIIFEAQIYDENGVAVPVMYQYDKSFYKDLKALNDAVKNDEGEAIFAQYLDENNINGELDNELKKQGVITYRNGKCYYFSSQIKHFADTNEDDKEGGKGVMEFAIMRNNIYSLAVTSIDKFGYASTNIEEIANTDEISDLSIYLTMEAKILPWIVRFNNIEF